MTFTVVDTPEGETYIRFMPRKPCRTTGQLGSRQWRRLRDQVVREEPVCRLRLPGCTIASQTGDHIIPIKYRPDLKLVRANVRGSCHSCNMKRGDGSPSRMADVRRKAAPPPPALEFFR